MPAELTARHVNTLNMSGAAGRATSAPTLDMVDESIESKVVGWYEYDEKDDDVCNVARTKRVRFCEAVTIRPIPMTGRCKRTPARGVAYGMQSKFPKNGKESKVKDEDRRPCMECTVKRKSNARWADLAEDSDSEEWAQQWHKRPPTRQVDYIGVESTRQENRDFEDPDWSVDVSVESDDRAVDKIDEEDGLRSTGEVDQCNDCIGQGECAKLRCSNWRLVGYQNRKEPNHTDRCIVTLRTNNSPNLNPSCTDYIATHTTCGRRRRSVRCGLRGGGYTYVYVHAYVRKHVCVQARVQNMNSQCTPSHCGLKVFLR